MQTMSELEMKARCLCEVTQHDTSVTTIIKNVFRAMWASALPREQVADIGRAMHRVEFSQETYDKALSRLVRARVLRSRRQGGQLLYELNY